MLCRRCWRNMECVGTNFDTYVIEELWWCPECGTLRTGDGAERIPAHVAKLEEARERLTRLDRSAG